MAGEGKKVEVRYGAFACSIEGYEDPVEKLREVLGMMQTMIAETPEMRQIASDFDAEEARDFLDERSTTGGFPSDIVTVRNVADEPSTPETEMMQPDPSADAASAVDAQTETNVDVDPTAAADRPGQAGASAVRNPPAFADADTVEISDAEIIDDAFAVAEARDEATEATVEPRPAEFVEDAILATDQTNYGAAPPHDEINADPVVRGAPDAADATPPGAETGTGAGPEQQINIFADMSQPIGDQKTPVRGPDSERPAEPQSDPGLAAVNIFADPGTFQAPENDAVVQHQTAATDANEHQHSEDIDTTSSDSEEKSDAAKQADNETPSQSAIDTAGPVNNRFSDILNRGRGLRSERFTESTQTEDANQRLLRMSAAELAQRLQATSVPELLTAAAAWLTLVGEKPQFTRREMMTIFQALPGDHPRSMEARVKGYGSLVRSGTLVLVEDGVFRLARRDRKRIYDVLSGF